MSESSSLSLREWVQKNNIDDMRKIAVSFGIPYNTFRGYLYGKTPSEINRKILFERTGLNFFKENIKTKKSINKVSNEDVVSNDSLNLKLKEWYDKRNYASVADFAREIGISQKTITPWFLGRKIGEKHKMKLYLMTGINDFSSGKNIADIEKIREVSAHIDSLVTLMLYFQNSTPEARLALKEALKPRGQSIGYVYNLLRLMFDEEKFQEWKNTIDLLKNN